METAVMRGEVTGTTLQAGGACAPAGLHKDGRAIGAAIALCPDQLQSQPVADSARLIMEEMRRTGIGNKQDVRPAVIVEIAPTGSPSDQRSGDRYACRPAYLRK